MIVTLLLLEGGVRVVLSLSLTRYLTQTLPQPYATIMQKVGGFDHFMMGGYKFDPICYFIPKGGFFRSEKGSMDVPKEKEPGEIRIICIGDSTTYSVAVNYDDSWVALLGEKLKQRYPEKKLRVLNAGVPGASSKQIKRFFQFYLAPYRPDILIWRGGQGLSDTYSVNKTADSVRTFLWRCLYESRLFRVICVLLDKAEGRTANGVFYFMTHSDPQFFSKGRVERFNSDYDMVKKIAQDHGARYVLQVEYPNQEAMEMPGAEFMDRASNDLDPNVPMWAPFKDYKKKNPSKELFVDPVHLTEAGEAITAEGVAKFIIDNRWIESFPDPEKAETH
ncbi:MAG: hypothetical protein KTQ49_02505 [Candidatus Omnitrophica bacterium]|nr:hypothetical protein [Candidatus Omnitrophota bacterium]